MEKDSQCKMVMAHLAKHKTITTMEAYELYGITRLPSRIYDLREEGHKIGMVWETGANRWGKSVTYGKYFLEKSKKGK